jgi:molecular chaperone GrpE (heat shock protein)
MKTPPEAYLIFREELKKTELEKERLKAVYDLKLREVNKELALLKEQIDSQQTMLRSTLDYATRLEEELDNLQKRIHSDKEDQKRSFH